jgi:hypothetical protein
MIGREARSVRASIMLTWKFFRLGLFVWAALVALIFGLYAQCDPFAVFGRTAPAYGPWVEVPGGRGLFYIRPNPLLRLGEQVRPQMWEDASLDRANFAYERNGVFVGGR